MILMILSIRINDKNYNNNDTKDDDNDSVNIFTQTVK
jgi:hypothetical protein